MEKIMVLYFAVGFAWGATRFLSTLYGYPGDRALRQTALAQWVYLTASWPIAALFAVLG